MSLSLLRQVKESGEDFEWYPTTDEMLSAVSRSLQGAYQGMSFSLLDIGAGDGRVFEYLHDAHAKRYDGHGLSAKYAIEKSDRLIAAMPADVCIVGTEFHQQTLIDKEVSVVFCNPPYSEFDAWATRIIREANAEYVYLVIPTRWKKSESIAGAIAGRQAKTHVLGTYGFMKAERQARAIVDIVMVTLRTPRYDRHSRETQCVVDPFELWFEEHFKIDVKPVETGYDGGKGKHKERVNNALVEGRNHVQTLCRLYRADLDKLLANYSAVATLDADILRELGVSLDGLKSGLKQKIKGLKTLYWQELFDRLDTITSRLITSTRTAMLEKMRGHMQVDFTEQNAYAVIIWALKNVNLYIDSQLVEVYRRLTNEENARAYKSNTHMTKDTWRYCSRHEAGERASHYTLDYRIVLNHYYAAQGTGEVRGYSWEYYNGLHNTAHEYIGDIFAVAGNLGFKVLDSSRNRVWVAGSSEDFHCTSKGSEFETLCSIRAYKNGNMHIKFSKRFMEVFNTEAGRLLGWLKTAREAQDEAGIAGAEGYWNSNQKIGRVALLPESVDVFENFSK